MAEPLSTELDAAGMRRVEAVVIGAGPAGAAAARELARHGAQVLLVDQAPFPRSKVCGGCVGRGALHELEALGLGDLPRRLGAVPLDTFEVRAHGRRLRLPLPGGVAISRDVFDAALVEEAQRAGAAFLPETRAAIGGVTRDGREVRLKDESIVAAVVIDARGLSRGVHERADDSYVGVAASIDSEHARAGEIAMAVGSIGYVGSVRLPDGRAQVAAALDRRAIGTLGAQRAITRILREAGEDPPWQNTPAWHGTPYLSSRPRAVAQAHWLAIGDAAGYVEPFTGEGIGWALASARAVAPIALDAIQGWHPSLTQAWTQTHRRLLVPRHRRCRWITRGLRHPLLARAGLQLLSLRPALASPLIRRIHSAVLR